VAEPKAAKTGAKSEGKPRRRKKAAAEPRSRGIPPDAIGSGAHPAELTRLAEAIQADGGTVLAPYKDPLGGHWQLFAALPIDLVEPTPYQRDLSKPHVERLSGAMDRLGRYLDPMIVVRGESPRGAEDSHAIHPYWTPNGNHRLAALKRLGARSVVAIVVPDIEVAHRILLLNTEKAHNLRERALEVIKMYEELATIDEANEETYALEFEEAALITLGLCYLENGRFSGGAYHPILRRSDQFIKKPLDSALEIRRERAKALMDLDKTVVEKVEALKAKGLTSPYLKSFVVARINPIRFRPKDAAPLSFDEVMDRMTKAAEKMNVEKIKVEDLAKSGGAPEE
jgi:ParB family transcriptional regulator, chromosome partitioning protein